jgi:hypothetical protein
MNDISFRIMLIAKLVWDLETSIFDVKTARLHEELKEEPYVNIREGMNSDIKHCL